MRRQKNQLTLALEKLGGIKNLKDSIGPSYVRCADGKLVLGSYLSFDHREGNRGIEVTEIRFDFDNDVYNMRFLSRIDGKLEPVDEFPNVTLGELRATPGSAEG